MRKENGSLPTCCKLVVVVAFPSIFSKIQGQILWSSKVSPSVSKLRLIMFTLLNIVFLLPLVKPGMKQIKSELKSQSYIASLAKLSSSGESARRREMHHPSRQDNLYLWNTIYLLGPRRYISCYTCIMHSSAQSLHGGGRQTRLWSHTCLK